METSSVCRSTSGSFPPAQILIAYYEPISWLLDGPIVPSATSHLVWLSSYVLG